MSVLEQRRWFTTDDYYKMAETGIIAQGERVELVEGEVIEKSPVGSRHAACVKRLLHFLSAALGERAALGVQDPVRLDDFSEPEPDISVLRPRSDFYASAHPGPSDILLLVEVSDSSLGFDRDVKLPIYSAAGIPEVWVVNLVENVVDAHRAPRRRRYEEVRRFRSGDQLTAAMIPDLVLEVDTILV